MTNSGKLTITRLCSAPMGTPGCLPKPSAQLTCLSQYSAGVLVGWARLDRNLHWFDHGGIDQNLADYPDRPDHPDHP